MWLSGMLIQCSPEARVLQLGASAIQLHRLLRWVGGTSSLARSLPLRVTMPASSTALNATAISSCECRRHQPFLRAAADVINARPFQWCRHQGLPQSMLARSAVAIAGVISGKPVNLATSDFRSGAFGVDDAVYSSVILQPIGSPCDCYQSSVQVYCLSCQPHNCYG